MKMADIRKLTTEDLNKKLEENKKELFNLRLQKSTNKLENPASIASTKRTIARIKTVIKEKEAANA